MHSFASTDENVDLAEGGDLQSLDALVKAMRGISLHDFPTFPDLARLDLLAVACRRRDDESIRRLFEHRPDLWPRWPPEPVVVPGQSEPYVYPDAPGIDRLELPLKTVREFMNAIAWFWDDVEYVHWNSVSPPTDRAEQRKALLRAARESRPETFIRP